MTPLKNCLNRRYRKTPPWLLDGQLKTSQNGFTTTIREIKKAPALKSFFLPRVLLLRSYAALYYPPIPHGSHFGNETAGEQS